MRFKSSKDSMVTGRSGRHGPWQTTKRSNMAENSSIRGQESVITLHLLTEEKIATDLTTKRRKKFVSFQNA